MEAKHTPGPWFVSSGGRNKIASVTAATGIYADVEPDGKSITADARLMAAATELLDIARRTEGMLTRQRWRDDGDDPESKLLRDCRAAIAKATQ